MTFGLGNRCSIQLSYGRRDGILTGLPPAFAVGPRRFPRLAGWAIPPGRPPTAYLTILAAAERQVRAFAHDIRPLISHRIVYDGRSISRYRTRSGGEGGQESPAGSHAVHKKARIGKCRES